MATASMRNEGGHNESPSTSSAPYLQGEIEHLSGDTCAGHIEIKDFAREAIEVGTGRAKDKANQGEEDDTQEEVVAKPQTARDREHLDAGKQALRELLKERKIDKKKKTSCFSIIRLYLTIIAALLIIGGLMVLIFLVPMTIDPALATINYNIETNPALCATLYVNNLTGSGGCACRNGCTKDIFMCQEIIVAYRKGLLDLPDNLLTGFNKTAFRLSQGDVPHSDNIVDDNIDVDQIKLRGNRDCLRNEWVFNEGCWDTLNATLLVNVKGCGYPPHVNCSIFLQSYNVTGRRFVCYFSKLNESVVTVNYNPNKPWEDLYLSLGYTCGAQILGTVMIFLLHFPFKRSWESFLNSLKKRKKKSTAPTPRTTAFKNRVRQPVFQRDWYDVHT